MDPQSGSEDLELSSRDLYLLDQAKRKKRKLASQPVMVERPKRSKKKSQVSPVPVPVACLGVHYHEDDMARIKVLQTCLLQTCLPQTVPNVQLQQVLPTVQAPEMPPVQAPEMPPVQEEFIDVLIQVMENLPPAQENLPPAQENLPPAQENLPPALCDLTPPVVLVEKVSIFKKQFVPVSLERMYGQDSAIQSAKTWFLGGHWKKKPLIVWGPSGTGKTLLCSLLAAAFQSTFVSFEDEFDVKDKVKGWLQGSRSQGLGLLAFTNETHKQAWLFLDDFDSIEGECRKDLLPLLKPYMEAKSTKQFPAPVMITCENVHDKKMAGLKAMKNWVQLVPHSISDLIKLARAVAPNLDASSHQQLAVLAHGDARRLIMEARFAKELHNVPKPQQEDAVYHSPFDAVKALISKPAIESRALDGQEFMVQQLMYQNYPLFNSSLEVISQVADEFCQLDLLDSEHEFPEYSEVYLTYIIPKEIKGKVKFNLNLNPKYMKQTFEKTKKGKMLI